MIQFVGKECSENELVIDKLYWITSQDTFPCNPPITRAKFQGFSMNNAQIPILKFYDAYVYSPLPFRDFHRNEVYFRHWFPIEPYQHYYEVPSVSNGLKVQIYTVARKIFERRQLLNCSKIINLSDDILSTIISYIPL